MAKKNLIKATVRINSTCVIDVDVPAGTDVDDIVEVTLAGESAPRRLKVIYVEGAVRKKRPVAKPVKKNDRIDEDDENITVRRRQPKAQSKLRGCGLALLVYFIGMVFVAMYFLSR